MPAAIEPLRRFSIMTPAAMSAFDSKATFRRSAHGRCCPSAFGLATCYGTIKENLLRTSIFSCVLAVAMQNLRSRKDTPASRACGLLSPVNLSENLRLRSTLCHPCEVRGLDLGN